MGQRGFKPRTGVYEILAHGPGTRNPIIQDSG